MQSCAATQAMSQMLPSLRMTAADLEERLSSLPQASDVTGVTEAAQLDATIDTIKVRRHEPIVPSRGGGFDNVCFDDMPSKSVFMHCGPRLAAPQVLRLQPSRPSDV